MNHPDEDLVPGAHLRPEERDPEVPVPDAAEQARTANPSDEPDDVHRGLEVSEYDAMEQSRTVEMDDDYR
jgi:hypothetical protein